MDMKTQINYGQPGSIEYILKSMQARSTNGIVSIAPGIAKRMIDEINFKGQRKIDTGRVFGKRRDIIKGDWIDEFPITLVVFCNGQMWIVDGQHRLTAISEHDAPVNVTLRIVPMDSQAEARKFYAGFDQRGSVRTNLQIIDAVDLAENSGLTRTMATIVYEAASIIGNNLEPVAGSANCKKNPQLFLQNNRLNTVLEWSKEAQKYEEILKLAKKAHLLKMRGTGMVAVALYTLRHQPAKAIEFWRGVAENDGLRKNDPRAALIYDMHARSMVTGNVRQKVQQPCLAWNAWCEGRNLSIIKCLPGAALTLWGTPLNGKGGK